MFRKNNKPIELQSSESDVSSENERESPQAYQKSRGQQHSDNERDSLSESEDNELEDSLQKTDYQKKQLRHSNLSQQQSEEEEQSSDEGGEAYFRNMNAKNGIHTIREDPGQCLEQEDSIDHIQQRIKKLEKDLQTRLNKHKEKPQTNKKQQGRIISKAPSHPPIPQKKNNQHQQSQNKMGTMNQAQNKFQDQKQKKGEKIENKKKPIETLESNPNQTIKPKRIISKQSNEPNPELKLENKAENKPSSDISKKAIKPKKETIYRQDEKHNLFNDRVVASESHSKVNQLEKLVKQLRLQNQILKQKLQSEKIKKEKPKNKAVQQLEKLKQASSVGDKLEKQIQLLQVIEKLQAKLKKSISRKLAKQGNATSSLLHKGLPTSIQSHY